MRVKMSKNPIFLKMLNDVCGESLRQYPNTKIIENLMDKKTTNNVPLRCEV